MLLSICLGILLFLREVNCGATTDLLFFTSLDGILLCKLFYVNFVDDFFKVSAVVFSN